MWTKAIKEDQAFSFVTHTFALTGEDDYLMFKPSARVLLAKSIVSICAQLSSAFHFLGNFKQADIFRQFSAVWYFQAVFSRLIFLGSFQQTDIYGQFSDTDIFGQFSAV